jgi:hypothetical protein
MVPVPVGCFRPSKGGAGINKEFLEYRVLFHITLFPRIKKKSKQKMAASGASGASGGAVGAPLSGEVLSELTSMETPAAFSAALANLWQADQVAMIGFFISKEYQASMKNAFQNQEEDLRRLAILGYGKLFLRVWAIIHQEGTAGLEGFIKFNSLAEVRRAMDDFIDFGVDMVRQFSTALSGAPIVSSDITQPPISLTYSCFCAYCEVLNDMLSVAVATYSNLRRWCDALQGTATVSSSNPIDVTHWQILVSTCVSSIIKDVGEIQSWSTRWRACEAYFRLISSAILIILHDIPSHHTLSSLVFDPLHSSSANMFGLSSNADETLGSRTGAVPLNIANFAEQWVLNSLSYFWEVEAVCSKDECLASIWEAMEITQHGLLAHARFQVHHHLSYSAAYITDIHTVFRVRLHRALLLR